MTTIDDSCDAGIQSALPQIPDELFHNIVESASDGIVVTDVSQRIVYVNPAFEKLTGYSLDAVRNKIPGRVLQGPLSDQNVIARMRIAIRECRKGNFEVINYTSEGKPIWVNLWIYPLFDRSGEHVGYFSFHKDVTRRELVQLQLGYLNQDLMESNRQLELSKNKMERVAHALGCELDEPIHNIVELTDMITQSAGKRLTEEERSRMSMIRESASRLIHLIRSLLD